MVFLGHDFIALSYIGRKLLIINIKLSNKDLHIQICDLLKKVSESIRIEAWFTAG